jgi:hypothetical protein
MIGELATRLPEPGGGGGTMMGELATSLPEPGGGGGTMIGELATRLPEPGGGGGTMMGELATSLPEPGGGGGTMIGELATRLPEPGGGGGTMMGELATAKPVPKARTEVRITRRTFNGFTFIEYWLLWNKLCTEMVPHKLYNFYDKSNFLKGLAVYSRIFLDCNWGSSVSG